MGMRVFLIAPAILIFIVSIVFQGGNLQTGQANAFTFCATGTTTCVPPGTTTSITCTNFLIPCNIAPSCIVPTPSPAWCFPWPFSLIPSNAGTWLNAGATVILNSQQFNQGITPTSGLVNFGSIGPSGWIIMIFVIVGFTALASITVLNSGMGSSGVFLLAMGGMYLGVWTFLSIMDGFITGNPASLFSQLNLIVVQGQNISAGTFVYIFSSLLFVISFIGAIDRGT